VSKRVLITGMTARHYSQGVVDRSASFTQALSILLRDLGYTVDIQPSSVEWTTKTFKQYDRVLIGIAPPMALSSNGTYGALSTISTLYGTKKMLFFVDCAEHWQIFANLKAITRDHDKLFKPFYSRRNEYVRVDDHKVREKVLEGIEILSSRAWPRTVYPLLPWSSEIVLTSGSPENTIGSFRGIHVDSVYDSEEMSFYTDRRDCWLVENDKTRWSKSIANLLTLPTATIRGQKLRTDEQIAQALSRSLGIIIGPTSDKKFWWSPRYVQALNTTTPIVTEWRDSSQIGDAWTHLAASVEEMSIIDRFELAVTQKKQYFSSIESRTETTDVLDTILRMK
jgi:hypothetical protein